MFDIVRNNRLIVRGLLLLMIPLFALFGIDAYLQSEGTGADVARVGKRKITTQEFREALREQQERMRAAAQGRQIPQEMLDTPQLRRSVLDTMINRQLLADFARTAHLGISDEQLSKFIASVPALQVDGKFSPERYEAAVAGQSLSKEAFEARLRQDLIMQQAVGGISASSFTARTAAALWRDALLEEREVSAVMFHPRQYLARVTLGAGAAQAYYDAKRKEFELPAQVRAEFVVLAQSELMSQVRIGEDEIQVYYDSHAGNYKQGEERRASHILILADAKAPEPEVAKARAKAESLLAQVKKDPVRFAALAKEHSQDPGSAAKGGDLDWFSRGAMVKPFEDAAFALKEGGISDVVRSDFGFHVIRVTGVRAEKGKTLADVRGEIEAELRQQAAAQRYAAAAEAFTNMVYEQSDSLQPVVEQFKLQPRQSDWIAKGMPGNGLASNPRLLAALFSDDVLVNKRNTEAIEVAPNTLVAARVIESRPATVLPFAEVKATIEDKLRLEEASKLAAAAGEASLAALKKGESADLAWSAARPVSRLGTQDMAREAIEAVFKAPLPALPAYVGKAGPDGVFGLYRISRVIPYTGGNPRAEQLREQYQQLVAAEEFAAWVGMLREKVGVDIDEKALLEKE